MEAKQVRLITEQLPSKLDEQLAYCIYSIRLRRGCLLVGRLKSVPALPFRYRHKRDLTAYKMLSNAVRPLRRDA